jgi:hypothetical protein
MFPWYGSPSSVNPVGPSNVSCARNVQWTVMPPVLGKKSISVNLVQVSCTWTSPGHRPSSKSGWNNGVSSCVFTGGLAEAAETPTTASTANAARMPSVVLMVCSTSPVLCAEPENPAISRAKCENPVLITLLSSRCQGRASRSPYELPFVGLLQVEPAQH